MGVGCSNKDQATITVSGDFTSYEIAGLEEGNRYTITVNASNAAGIGSASNAVTAMTQERGEDLSSQCFSLTAKWKGCFYYCVVVSVSSEGSLPYQHNYT